MDWDQIPIINIQKHPIPTIYLDTNIMILFSQYEKGECKDKYANEIAELYSLLTMLMKERRIICPLGNQLSEMGMTSRRKQAKEFLLSFTNESFISPNEIELAWSKKGYSAFIESREKIEFRYKEIFNESDLFEYSPFRIHTSPVYTQEKAEELHQEKLNTVRLINEAKKQEDVKIDFNTQLNAELESDYQVFLHSFIDPDSSQEKFNMFLNVMGKICRVTESLPNEIDLFQYANFLLSMYHHKLPFVRIRSYLWALRMQRPNNIQNGDLLDTSWVAAYLPFVDYAVTDNDCCKLIQEAELDTLCKTKVFSLKTITDLINELRGISGG